MGRPQRACSQKTVEQSKIGQWSNKEKRRLIQALIHCHPSDIDGIAQYIPTRSRREITTRIKSYKTTEAVPSDAKCELIQNNKTAVAAGVSGIELWCSLTRKMLSSYDVDLSYHMGQVCQVIAATEEMKLPPNQADVIRRIYVYLGDLLSGKTPENRLNRLEAVLMHDLLESLHDSVKQHKSTDGSKSSAYLSVNEYLKWKFVSLNSLGTIDHKNSNYRQLHAALNNDWAGFKLNTAENFLPRPASDLTMENTERDGVFIPCALYTLNPFCIPHNLVQFNDTNKQ